MMRDLAAGELEHTVRWPRFLGPGIRRGIHASGSARGVRRGDSSRRQHPGKARIDLRIAMGIGVSSTHSKHKYVITTSNSAIILDSPYHDLQMLNLRRKKSYS